ncbi:tetratricopeptide repeat protein (macronuclear) [Tetrahymena thermophila SB210]|uniref:Tetratricopeptide repeat protein n=1 Tax=Tetrahymena thermophila (strain SB210) TaxID=312017 RepID=I7ME75_TETTS|nr:tetratricopeptide repeat protein [Tetrahymena thermophila SB210]EAR95646.2 tetratricopeptide repeat protein [Tetrahymena thermophila SB210]|eukprot:XP_001015891.2 tetratricopeptide repeat protein [Tetrahymena thermophila SB210]
MIITSFQTSESDKIFSQSSTITKNKKYYRVFQAISVISIILVFIYLINTQNPIQNDTILKEIEQSEKNNGHNDILTEQDMDQLGLEFLDKNETQQAIRIYDYLHQKYPDNLKYLNSLAYAYFVSGDNKNAFLNFQKSLQLDQDNEFALFYTGLYYIQQQDNQNAKIFFQKVLTLNSKHEGALLNLGNLIYAEKEEKYEEKSAFYYMKCIESNQKNKECLYKMGILYFNRDSSYQAIKFFKLILDVDPQNALANCALGDAYYKLKQNNEALIYYKNCVDLLKQDQQQKELIYYYKKILQIDQKIYPEIINILADLYYSQQQYDDALLFYKQVIRMNPKDEKALLAIIEIYDKQNNIKEQIFWLKNLVELKNLNNDNYILKLADINYKIKNCSEAIYWYKQLFNKQNQNYNLALQIAQCYVDIEDDHAAELWYQKVLIIDQQNQISLEKLSELYYNERKKQQAAKYSQLCLNNYIQSLICNKITGFLYYDDGHYQEASQNLLMALKQDPYDPQALFTIAQTYEALKDYKKASFFYKKCITVNPIASIYKNLAECLLQIDDIEEAIKMLQKSIELDPSYQDSYLLLAKIYENQNEEQSSIEIYEKYYQIDPYDASVVIKLAKYFQKENNIEKSMNYYKFLIEIRESYEPAYQAISSLYLQQNKLDQAIFYFHQLISNNQFNEFAVAQYKYLIALKK